MSQPPSQPSPPAPLESAVVLVLRPGLPAAAREVLTAYNPRFRTYTLPGGKREACDTDLRATAVRELAEETGLAASARAMLQVARGVYGPPSGRLVSIFWCDQSVGILRPEKGHEHPPVWASWASVLEGPFGAFYREHFPDGIDFLRCSWVIDLTEPR